MHLAGPGPVMPMNMVLLQRAHRHLCHSLTLAQPQARLSLPALLLLRGPEFSQGECACELALRALLML